MSVILFFSFIIFIFGLFGLFLYRRHIFFVLICFELLLLSININFVTFAVFLDDFLGQIYVLMILTVAAAETALGLAILVIFYRIRGGISTELLNLLKSNIQLVLIIIIIFKFLPNILEYLLLNDLLTLDFIINSLPNFTNVPGYPGSSFWANQHAWFGKGNPLVKSPTGQWVMRPPIEGIDEKLLMNEVDYLEDDDPNKPPKTEAEKKREETWLGIRTNVIIFVAIGMVLYLITRSATK